MGGGGVSELKTAVVGLLLKTRGPPARLSAGHGSIHEAHMEEHPMAQQVIFVCIPLITPKLLEMLAGTGLPRPEPYKGSIRENCDTCYEGLWVGPQQAATRAALPPHQRLTICLICAAKLDGQGQIDETRSLTRKVWGQ